MIKRSQDQVTLFNKTIYQAVTDTGWSVVIMPEGILIDNYHHGYVHIHPYPDEHDIKEKIKDRKQSAIFKVVYTHIHKNEGLMLKELIKELK